MSILVQKFGGTSVADSEKILSAARKAVRAQQQGHQVVMVVSAMGKNTDMLVGLAREITERPSAREMDMLLSTGEQVSVALMAMALHSLDAKAVSLTGAQIGIKTDSKHTKARIQSISTERMRRLLDEGNIVIAAGFQGIDDDLNITTLGRGGSDTTAVALAAVLGADACEINTDVDGIYTTDPRVLPEARKMAQVSYDEMLELASLGAGVMHSRAIEFGKKFSVPIHVRSSFTDDPGSMIVAEAESPDMPVGGAAVTTNEARITISGIPDRPGTSLTIFSGIADAAIPVDMIVQNIGEDGKADLSFTVLRDDLTSTLGLAQKAADELGAASVTFGDDVAKISVVGLGMATQSGIADRTFRALADAGVNIHAITTSEIKISALVDREQSLDALRAVHVAFALHEAPATLTPVTASAATPSDEAAVVTQLAGMEDLRIEGVALDDIQARITVRGIPDRPGVAAAVFEAIASADIFVDMIVQSVGARERASLSFTVPQDQLERALEVTRDHAASMGCSEVSSSPRIAKLSVTGVGMRSHTGVAIRMFGSLAAADINVDMINTSEVRVNVVVDGDSGQSALEALSTAFADAIR